MQENYVISIVGRQKVDGETGEIEVTTLGNYVRKGAKSIAIDDMQNSPPWPPVLPF